MTWTKKVAIGTIETIDKHIIRLPNPLHACSQQLSRHLAATGRISWLCPDKLKVSKYFLLKYITVGK